MRPGGSPEGPERSGGRRCRRAPGVRRLVGGCRVEAGRKRTGFHRKLTPLPPGPPLTHRVGADCKVREVRAGGPRPLMPSRTRARSPIYLYWLFSLTRRYHVARLTPADSHGARSCSSGCPGPTHHTGRHAALAPTDKPALAPPCGLFPEPALLMPLDAPSCPVAAHRPPDAPNLSIGQVDGELSIQGARPVVLWTHNRQTRPTRRQT